MTDHHSYTHNLSSCEIKAWKKFRPERVRTHDLYDTGVVLYHTFWVSNIPVEGKEYN